MVKIQRNIEYIDIRIHTLTLWNSIEYWYTEHRSKYSFKINIGILDSNTVFEPDPVKLAMCPTIVNCITLIP